MTSLGAATFEEDADYISFGAALELTPEGLHRKDEVLAAVCDYLDMLRTKGIPGYTYAEVAQMSEINARTAELGAKGALLRGERDVQASKLRTAQLKGAQRAATAANGFDLGDDTSARILTSTDVMGEIDANTIAADAIASAWGYRMQAQNLRGEAAVGRASASGVSAAGSAVSSLLGDSGQVAASWYKFKKEGADVVGGK